MGGFKIRSLLFGIFFIVLPSFYGISVSHGGVSVACMMEYDKGGAPAVFKSLECPHWKPSTGSLRNYTGNCQFATLQGHRQYQEDRVACDLNMKIPFLGKKGLKEVTVGIVAIFDGHGGKEASEMASKLLFDYFYLHTLFNIHKLMALHRGHLPASDYESLHLEILKEALSQTIHDIDSKFTKEALKNNFFSGSTANVVLLVDGKILVANVGDSKAILFSEKSLSRQGAAGNPSVHLSATELTKDHHPDRDDERARIEAAGGSVTVWGVPRVNGVLAMSRSIGDVYLKKYGVIAVPEFTGWQHLTANDRYLVVASDGLFESLTPQHILDLLWAWESHFQGSQEGKLSTSCLSSASLSECIVKTAYERGSKDNISATVVSLR